MGSADGYGTPKTNQWSKGRSAYLPAPRFAFASATPSASDGSFEVGESWPSHRGVAAARGGKEIRYMELFLRGGSAREAFGRLNSGARLEISATS